MVRAPEHGCRTNFSRVTRLLDFSRVSTSAGSLCGRLLQFYPIANMFFTDYQEYIFLTGYHTVLHIMAHVYQIVSAFLSTSRSTLTYNRRWKTRSEKSARKRRRLCAPCKGWTMRTGAPTSPTSPEPTFKKIKRNSLEYHMLLAFVLHTGPRHHAPNLESRR